MLKDSYYTGRSPVTMGSNAWDIHEHKQKTSLKISKHCIISWLTWYTDLFIVNLMCQGWILRLGIDLLQSRLCGVLLRGKTRKNVEELYSWFLKTPYISIPTRKTLYCNAVFTYIYILKYLFGAFVLVVPIVDNQDYKRWIKRRVENTFIISIEKNILGCTASVIKRYYKSTYWIRN